MKTTLEWVMWKDKKPEKKEAQGRAILFECDNGAVNLIIYDMNHPLDFISGYNIIRWAYVNLPEEEEKVICDICKERKADFSRLVKPWELKDKMFEYACEKCIPTESDFLLGRWERLRYKEESPYPSIQEAVKGAELFDIKHSHYNFNCSKCSKSQRIGLTCDNCLNDGWIWPLKQLPEDDIIIEVINFDKEKIKARYCKGVGYFYDAETEGWLDDVIAWRPLREEVKRFENGDSLKNEVTGDVSIFYDGVWYNLDKVFKLGINKNESPQVEPRKPDFSKLKDGDLVVVNLEAGHIITGFFCGLYKNLDIGVIDISNMRDRMSDRKLGQIELSKIKKIICINIDETFTFLENIPGTVKYNDVNAYKFEEI